MRITVQPSHTTLLKALQSAGHFLPAICNGRGTCGKCAVRVISGTVAESPADRARFSDEELKNGWRLACQAFPVDVITVEIPDSGEQNFSAVDVFEDKGVGSGGAAMPRWGVGESHAGEAGSHGIAVDIGTTTLGFALVDFASGKIAARYSAVNRQREYGADVISRIQSANNGNLGQLSGIIRSQISEGIARVCTQAGIDARRVAKIAVAGNTTMLHLLLNLSCETLGQAPFTPVTLDMTVIPYGEIFSGALDCDVVTLPGISTYVGADITSGIFFSGLHESKTPVALIDIGTNGELALIHEGKILCTATAAGPAFEGGNILWGTGSVPGAISHAQFKNGAWKLRTILDRPTSGICGSGVIDIVYQGLKNGLILPSGRLAEGQQNGFPLAKAGDGRDIIFCQKDVRELQLAKSAIRTGLDALLNHTGLGYDDLGILYLAGGFGYHIFLECAAGIGLIPEPLLPKVSAIGNSSLGGAVQYLLWHAGGRGAACDDVLGGIIGQSVEFNLPDDDYFSENFVTNINFE